MLEHDNGNIFGIYHIRLMGDPVLMKATKEIEDFNGALQQTVKTMQRFLGPNAIGLAANQVGLQKDIFVWSLDGPPQAMINPAFVDWSSTSFESKEGCLSIPGRQFTILRSKEVTIEYKDLDGNTKVKTSRNPLESSLFQHEMDHLAGIIAPYSKNLIRVD